MTAPTPATQTSLADWLLARHPNLTVGAAYLFANVLVAADSFGEVLLLLVVAVVVIALVRDVRSERPHL